MKRIFIVALVLASFGLSDTSFAQAKRPTAKKIKIALSKKKPTPRLKILSYQQMQRLSKAKRIRYLRDLKDVLIILEKQQRRYEVAANSDLKKYRDQIASLIKLMSLLPEADAQPTKAVTRTQKGMPPVAPDYGAIRPIHQSGEWRCAESAGLADFNDLVGTCLVMNSSGSTFFSRTGEPGMRCPEDTMPIPHPPGESGQDYSGFLGCIPKASWDLKPKPEQKNIFAKVYYPAGFFRRQDNVEAQRQAVVGRELAPETTTGAPASVAPSRDRAQQRGNHTATMNATPRARGRGPETQTNVPRAMNTRTATGGATSEVSLGGDPRVNLPPSDLPAAPPAPVGADSRVQMQPGALPAASAETAQPDPAPAAAAAVAAATGTCEVPRLACNDVLDMMETNPEEARRIRTEAETDFRSNARIPPVCISGGFYSTYPSDLKQKGTCDILESLPGLPRTAETGCPADRPNMAQCNPITFCIEAATDQTTTDPTAFKPLPFCVDTTANAERNRPITETCDQEWQRMRDGRKVRLPSGEEMLVAGRPEFKQVRTCDPFTVPIQENLQSVWEEWRNQTVELIKNWCVNPDYESLQIMFCKECQIVFNRLYEALERAEGRSCGAVTPQESATTSPVEGAGAAAVPVDDGAPAAAEPAIGIQEGSRVEQGPPVQPAPQIPALPTEPEDFHVD